MQVPVFPDDIKRHSFKRLAKTFQKNWPGTQPIQLSLAQELLAKGLGYQGYHDLIKQSESYPDNSAAPSKTAIQFKISEMIRAELSHGGVPPKAISSFVSNLPLYVLSVYHTPARSYRAHAANTTTRKTPILKLSSRDLKILVGHVAIQGSLRENALIEFIVTGARSHEFLGLQKKHISASSEHLIAKKDDFVRALPLSSTLAMIGSGSEYNQEDFLFPSSINKAKPMSSRELSTLFKKWVIACNLNSTATPHSARVAVISSLIKDSSLSPSTLKDLMLHKHATTLLNYYESFAANGS
ncbi:tyrosine-type recombinase/integrase [Pseudomonas sp. 35 E 8]|uniref:tyrosine-type recombinase/integrase n=1 Tax=Pseudomonas sp. 35 E 8 TaxID=1844103 RepID=UPI000812081D|nr:tyrosine-type recombinase/integrase [Pseudomonas sp. 35 E 8]CRM19659.1 Site-specific recombinase XerD [Pseudomonas sp. 35 E 8]